MSENFYQKLITYKVGLLIVVNFFYRHDSRLMKNILVKDLYKYQELESHNFLVVFCFFLYR